jgi:LmbE family N-acetylglucosaminyl deacetylase
MGTRSNFEFRISNDELALHSTFDIRHSPFEISPAIVPAMKALFLHAHYDDYEFTAAGTFELWRRRFGPEFRGRVVVCTDGQAGHQFRPRQETGLLRLKEQEEAAQIGQFEFDLLRLPDGSVPREACLQVTPALLASLWKVIRDFEPDYLFCPPLGADPLAGIHNDHETIAEAVRRVGYMINVPHAFTPEYPADETRSTPCRVPVILNVYDGYMFGSNACDVVVDVEESFELISRLTWCHQSQIREWLPWVGRHNMEPPATLAEWTTTLRARFDRKNRELGLKTEHAVEVFSVTAWGAVPTLEELVRDFPPLLTRASALEPLAHRLDQWRGK